MGMATNPINISPVYCLENSKGYRIQTEDLNTLRELMGEELIIGGLLSTF